MTIYVAGPYTGGDPVINVRNACLAGEALVAKGHTPVVPHLFHLWHLCSPHDYEYWLSLDRGLLGLCDALVRLPGVSPGAHREVEWAMGLGLSIFLGVDDVPYAPGAGGE